MCSKAFKTQRIFLNLFISTLSIFNRWQLVQKLRRHQVQHLNALRVVRQRAGSGRQVVRGTAHLNADHPGAVADWHLGVGTSLRLAIVDGLGDLVQYGRRQLDQGGWDFERQCHIREVHGHRAVGGVLLEPDEDSGCRGNADQAGEEQNKLHLESDSGLRLKSVGEGFGFYRQICWNKIVLRMCEPYG